MPSGNRRSSGEKTEAITTPEEKGSDPEFHSFTLRVHKSVIDQVDEVVSKHPVIRNRNTWIVNAIVEQLKRERQG